MNSYIELIKTLDFNKENEVNLHIHTNYSDGKCSPLEILNSAKEKGYKYISITDHNTLNAYLENDFLNCEMVISGIEFDCWEGTVFLHLLGYGVDIHNPELQSVCAKTKNETEADIVRIFSKRSAKKMIEIIHNAGGIAVLAHPACCLTLSHERFIKKLKKFGLDGVEVYYPYSRHRGIIKFNTAKNIEKIADKLGLLKTGGTDCHTNL